LLAWGCLKSLKKLIQKLPIKPTNLKNWSKKISANSLIAKAKRAFSSLALAPAFA